MILTKKDLERYQENMKVSIPDYLKSELLDKFGSTITDAEGHVFEYSEQDIHEQVRKIIQQHAKGG